ESARKREGEEGRAQLRGVRLAVVEGWEHSHDRLFAGTGDDLDGRELGGDLLRRLEGLLVVEVEDHDIGPDLADAGDDPLGRLGLRHDLDAMTVEEFPQAHPGDGSDLGYYYTVHR